MGYPDVAEEPAEVWTPPERPIESSIHDSDGHPLTWGTVAYAHAWLVSHASCEPQGAAGYSSDEEGAPAAGGCPPGGCSVSVSPTNSERSDFSWILRGCPVAITSTHMAVTKCGESL